MYQEESRGGELLRVERGGGVSVERLELIRRQVERGKEFLSRRYGARSYTLYFQAFSNTFAPIPVLREIYDYALSLASFRELIISTRPDCIARSHAELLASYIREDFDVWAELGLQSFHDRTLERINRAHTSSRFVRAFSLLRERGVKITVHLIFGLPGEGRQEIMETVERLAAMRPDAVKIHNLNIAAGSEMEREYRRGELSLPSDSRHLEYVTETLERLPEGTVIQRVTCDTRQEYLVAPLYFMDKNRFYSLLGKEMQREGLRQGRLFEK